MSYDKESGMVQLLLDVDSGSLSTYQVKYSLVNVSVQMFSDGNFNSNIENTEEMITGLLFSDYDPIDKTSATLFEVREEGFSTSLERREQYLTVITKDAKTSCTLRLSQYNSHGHVLTDDVFGIFKFSPCGRYICL